MDINKFLGGLDTDSHPSQQKEHTIRYGLNFIPMTEEGNLYSITNESGTKLMSNIKFPTGFKPIGHTILNNDIIVILCDATNNSQIGYIVEDDSPDATTGFYHASGPVDSSGLPVSNNSELGFQKNRPVDCVSRKLINGHRLLYFTDNNVPYGFFDLDEPPVVGKVAESVKLIFDQSVPKITVTEIIEGVQSSIQPGVVQFITRYVTANGGTTIFGLPSEVFPIVTSEKKDGVSAYSGEFYEFGIVNKNLVVKFENVDTKYQELEVVALFYESSSSVFRACVVGQVPISGDTVEFTYTGPNTENLINLTRAELQQVGVSYTHAKCIEQKDNSLFLSNLRDDRSKLSGDLQDVANKIRVKYRIENVQFSGRGDDVSTTPSLVFTNTSNPFLQGNFTCTLPMNEDVDSITAIVPATYQLIKNGTPAAAAITIVDYTQIVVGNTIIISAPTGAGYTGSQVAVTFTAIAAGASPTAEQFAIGTDNNNTAINLFTAINNSLLITEYFAIAPTANVVSLSWSTVDIAANSTVTSNNTAAITATSFAGANTTVVTINATTAVVSVTNEIDITFPQTVNVADELIVLSPGFKNATLTDDFETGTSGLPVLAVQPVGSAGLNVVPGFTDYTNEFLTATKKGYRRGEVYSLGFKVLWKDGSMSTAFHIPGYAGYTTANTKGKIAPTGADLWPTTNVGTGTGQGYLGTYVSEDLYSLDQKYPGNDTGDDTTEQGPAGIERNIRHHYIPRLENEPHYKNDGGVEFIRVLGLDFEFTQAIPQSILEEADDIIFLRERRNTDNNKSIYSQGLIHKHMITADGFNNDGQVLGTALQDVSGSAYDNMKSNYHLQEIPFFNLNFEVTGLSNFEDNGAEVRTGMVNPIRNVQPSNATYQNGKRMISEVIKNQVMFHSPESNLETGFKLKEAQLVGQNLVEELRIKGKIIGVNFKGDRQNSRTGGLINNEYRIDKFMYFDSYCNYSEIDTVPIDSAKNREIEDARYLEPNIERHASLDPDHPALKTNTRWNQGGLQLLLNADSFTTNGGAAGSDVASMRCNNTYMYKDSNDFTGTVTSIGSKDVNNNFTSHTGSSTAENLRSLYNISIDNLKQYGQINNAAYIPIKRTPIKNPVNGVGILVFNSVFGGDTFISKYSFNAGILVRYDPFYDGGTYPINSAKGGNTQRPGSYGNVVGTGTVNGWDFRTCTYYFVESNINTNYRHRPADEPLQDYFPNEIDMSKMLHNWYPYLKNIQAYNTQYSYENNVIESFLGGSTQQTISDFENRTIYSEKAAEEDTLDSYRSFLQNDYYDLPSEKGPIWDTFIEFNTLFMHTPKALWQTFAEGQATIKGGNIADAILGTSRLFARPAQEVLETDGGYGGSISQYGGAHTQLGYIFADILQGKIFLVGATKTGGTILKEISKEGISTEMHKTLSLGITKISGQTDLTNVSTKKAHLIDNPYLGIGIVSGYDYKLNRYLITKFPVDGQTNGFTLSYAKDIGKWFNYHSYMPNIYISYNNRFLFVDNKTTTSQFHEMNIGPKGSYFGTVYDSELTFVVTTKGQTCTFNNIVINSVSKDRTTNIKQRDDNFYKMSAHNQISNTGPYTMIPGNTFNVAVANGEVSVKYRNNEYRITIPRDSVVDNSIDLFATTNLDNTKKFRERIKGDHIVVNLKYDNTLNLEFVLNFLKTIFTNNFR